MLKKINFKSKHIALVTVVILFLLTVVSCFLGVRGQKLDSIGLYKLLPWIPIPSEKFEWRTALVPGADFGVTEAISFTFNEGVEEEKSEVVRTLSSRLSNYGLSSFSIEEHEGNYQLKLPNDIINSDKLELLLSKGEFSFAGPDGEDFLSGKHITRANVAPADQTGSSWYLAFELDSEGKDIFAKKTTELVNEMMLVKRDGVELVRASIAEPLVDGGASIPGFTFDDAYINAILMKSGALPYELNVGETLEGEPMLGENSLNGVIIALWIVIAVIMLVFLIKYRLAGLAGLWTVASNICLSWLIIALIQAGFNLSSLLAFTLSTIILVCNILMLFQGMSDDLKSGRSAKQSLKDSYASNGKLGLDIMLALFFFALIIIIMDTGVIGHFMQLFAVCMLVNIIMVQLGFRLMLNSMFNLFGEKTSLYITANTQGVRE
ncbi:MAG TPA: hypothetical protein GXZ91_05835 [Christensenellaceae bacterium]|nr:hypothetical protein [Christensenellaceae bacterium]